MRKENWLGLAIAVVLPGLCLLFVIPAMLSNNIFFAVDRIEAEPVQVVVYYGGDVYAFEPDDAEYDLLVDACYATLYEQNGFNEWGWSDARFHQARSEGMAVELLYAEPVKLPGNRVNAADPTRLFFPLNVFGFSGEVVFRGGESDYWGGPIRVDTLDRVRDAVCEVLAIPQT